MIPTKHVDVFRQQLEFPYFSRYSLANIFEVSEEQVLDRFLAERWKGVNWSEVPAGRNGRRDERLYSAKSMPYETRMELVSGLTSCLEEAFGPLLVGVSWNTDRYLQIFRHTDSKLLQAALYRSSQFQYARVAARELRLTDYDATTAVAEGFGIAPEILHDLRERIDFQMFGSPQPNTLFDMEAHLAFLALMHELHGGSSSSLFPEFPMETITVH